MTHPWFAEVTWERLAKKGTASLHIDVARPTCIADDLLDIDAPYVPPVRGGAGDASLFDKYPEETEAYGQTGDDP